MPVGTKKEIREVFPPFLNPSPSSGSTRLSIMWKGLGLTLTLTPKSRFSVNPRLKRRIRERRLAKRGAFGLEHTTSLKSRGTTVLHSVYLAAIYGVLYNYLILQCSSGATDVSVPRRTPRRWGGSTLPR